MPFHELAVAPADVDGAALGLALNAPAPTPLASIELAHHRAGTLVLGVLGASHVVTVDHPDGRFSEEVSCSAHVHGRALPGAMMRPDTASTARQPIATQHISQHWQLSCTNAASPIVTPSAAAFPVTTRR